MGKKLQIESKENEKTTHFYEPDRSFRTLECLLIKQQRGLNLSHLKKSIIHVVDQFFHFDIIFMF